MFTECAVFCSVYPICSAIAMKRLLKTSSRPGSHSVPTSSRPRQRPDPPQQQHAAGAHLGLPAGFQHHRAVVLDHDRRRGHHLARLQCLSPVQRHRMGSTTEDRLHAGQRFRLAEARLRRRLPGLFPHPGHRLDHAGRGHQRPILQHEAETLAAGFPESRGHLRHRPHRDRQRGVRALVADLHRGVDRAAVFGEALAREFRQRLRAQRVGAGPDPRRGLFGVERLLQTLLAQGADLGDAHAVGGQHPRQRVQQHLTHVQRVGHPQACCPPAPPKHTSA